jgi:hypothetical protein
VNRASGAVHAHARIPRQPPPNHTHRRMRRAKVSANAERALHISGSQPSASERGSCHSLHLLRNTIHAAAAAPAKRRPRGMGACSSTQRVSVDWEGASLGSHATGNRAASTRGQRCANNAEPTHVWHQGRGCGARQHPGATGERRTIAHLAGSASAWTLVVLPTPARPAPSTEFRHSEKDGEITVWRLRAAAGRGSRHQMSAAGPACGTPPSLSPRTPVPPLLGAFSAILQR